MNENESKKALIIGLAGCVVSIAITLSAYIGSDNFEPDEDTMQIVNNLRIVVNKTLLALVRKNSLKKNAKSSEAATEPTDAPNAVRNFATDQYSIRSNVSMEPIANSTTTSTRADENLNLTFSSAQEFDTCINSLDMIASNMKRQRALWQIGQSPRNQMNTEIPNVAFKRGEYPQ